MVVSAPSLIIAWNWRRRRRRRRHRHHWLVLLAPLPSFTATSTTIISHCIICLCANVQRRPPLPTFFYCYYCQLCCQLLSASKCLSSLLVVKIHSFGKWLSPIVDVVMILLQFSLFYCPWSHSRCFVSVIVVIHICCSRGWSSSSLVVIVVVACHGCCLPSPLLPTTTQSLSSLPMHTNMTATTLLPVIFQPSILALLTIFINRLSAILHNNISSTKELFIPGLTHFTYIVSPVGTGSDFTSTRCVCLTRTLNNTSASPVAEYYMCLFLYQLFENSVHPGS